MTTEELNERRRRGLCFKCNEKFGPGHKCKKFFLIQATLVDSDDDVEMEDDGITEEQPSQQLEISLHAIAGLRTPDTIRVLGTLAHRTVTLLSDLGSSHNFVCQKMAKKAGLQPVFKGHLEVMVASGEKLVSLGKCSQTQINLQCHPIVVDFYLLPIEGYDVIPGTQWLSSLGPIEWDFSKLFMNFELGGRKLPCEA